MGVSQKSIFKRPCQLLAINAHKMAPRTTQWLQERPWNAPTKGLLWISTCPSGEKQKLNKKLAMKFSTKFGLTTNPDQLAYQRGRDSSGILITTRDFGRDENLVRKGSSPRPLSYVNSFTKPISLSALRNCRTLGFKNVHQELTLGLRKAVQGYRPFF